MERIKLGKKSLSEILDRYEETYGHPPSPLALEYSSLEELNELAGTALQLGYPVKEWNDFWEWGESTFTLEQIVDEIETVNGPHLEQRELDPEVFVESVMKDAYVYVLDRVDATTPISKIGSTTVSAERRAKDYYDGDWKVHSSTIVPALLRFPIEKMAQKVLIDEGYWLDPKLTGGSASEIFLCEPERAEEAVSASFDLIASLLLEKLGKEEILKGTLNDLDKAHTEIDDLKAVMLQRDRARLAQVEALSDRLTAEQQKSVGKQDLKRQVESLMDEINELKRELTKNEKEINALKGLLRSEGLQGASDEIQSFKKFYKNAPTKKKWDLYSRYYDRMLEILEDAGSR